MINDFICFLRSMVDMKYACRMLLSLVGMPFSQAFRCWRRPICLQYVSGKVVTPNIFRMIDAEHKDDALCGNIRMRILLANLSLGRPWRASSERPCSHHQSYDILRKTQVPRAKLLARRAARSRQRQRTRRRQHWGSCNRRTSSMR